MEYRELTSSILAFLGMGCAEHILEPRDKATFVRRRNQWIALNLSRGLSGLVIFDSGKIMAYTLELPVHLAPLPVVGNNIGIVICHWTAPPLCAPNHKKLLWERTIERLTMRGFNGIASFCASAFEAPIFESLGFRAVSSSDCLGAVAELMFLEIGECAPPALKHAQPLPPPMHRKFALDIFYPSFCPLGTIILNRVLGQMRNVAAKIELRIHDTSDRKVVLQFGRTMGCFLNGESIIARIVANAPLEEIIALQEQ